MSSNRVFLVWPPQLQHVFVINAEFDRIGGFGISFPLELHVVAVVARCKDVRLI